MPNQENTYIELELNNDSTPHLVIGGEKFKMENYNELYHYGVKGMKWGVRRYQNADGSLTEAGKKRIKEQIGKYDNENIRKQFREDSDSAKDELVTNSFGTSYTVPGKARVLNKYLNDYRDKLLKDLNYIDSPTAKAETRNLIRRFQLEQDVKNNVDTDNISKKGYKIHIDEFGCDIDKIAKDGTMLSIQLSQHKDGIYRVTPDTDVNKSIKAIEDYANSDKLKTTYKNILNNFYEENKQYIDSSKEDFEAGASIYILRTYQKGNGCEIGIDGGESIGHHSIDALVDMNTGKIHDISMNG